MTNRATIRDVARRAGVSTTTVSDALNGRGRLPEETRARVRAIAGELDYRASASARALQAGRTGQIALLYPPLAYIASGLAATGYYAELAMGAAEVSLADELALVLLPSNLTPERLSTLDVDGLIIVDPLRSDLRTRAFSQRELPIVTCERDPTPGADRAGCVRSDHTAAMYELLEHLCASGARRIALVAAGDEMAWNAELRTAHRGWCEAHGMAVLQAQIPTFPQPEYTEAAVAQLLQTDRPDAIVCSQPGAAAALVRTLTNQGVRVPDDLLVAACVDEATAVAANPPVTAVDLQPTLLGRRAATLLAALLAGRTQPGTELTVPTRLVLRASTAAPGS